MDQFLEKISKLILNGLEEAPIIIDDLEWSFSSIGDEFGACENRNVVEMQNCSGNFEDHDSLLIDPDTSLLFI